MSILIDESTKVIVQGISGRDGSFHSKVMLDYGTKIVGGYAPGKNGQVYNDVYVYESVKEAAEETGADTSIIFVPAQSAADAVCEAADAGIKLIVVITEGIPILDMIKLTPFVKKNNSRLLGPNCPGIISPGKSKVGIMPTEIFQTGDIGLISRSGTLTYEIVNGITVAGMGQSTCIGIGGDEIIGLGYIDLLEEFDNDPDTSAIVLVGEIGGNAEEQAAEFISSKIKKPVVAFIAGLTAPKGKRMGHAGAIIARGSGTAGEKVKSLEKAGIAVAKEITDIPKLLSEVI